MKTTIQLITVCIFFTACTTTASLQERGKENALSTERNQDTLIVQSLFADKASSISEDNIQKILDGHYQLPQHMRVAVLKLSNNQSYKYFWNDELYLKNQQSYTDLFTSSLTQSPRVKRVSLIPDLLVSKSPTFTNLREAAVRMQADVVIVFSVANDIYTRYKMFSKDDIKAFATVEAVMLDIRTGLVVFSSVITKDVLSQQKKEELDIYETRNRVKNEAVLLGITELSKRITDYLNIEAL